MSQFEEGDPVYMRNFEGQQVDSSKHSQKNWASIVPGATRGGADH